MSAWTNAYWPRSGERGSASSVEDLAPDERPEARLEVGRRRPLTAAEPGEREALAEDGRVGDEGPIVRRQAVEARRR